MTELDRGALLELVEHERELRKKAEEALARHSRELSLAADELMLQADALLERDRLASQMEIARRIQLSVQPRPLVTASYEVATSMDAAELVGGDLCDVRERREALWLAIGDVTGHGIDAGLVMLMAQSAFALATDVITDCDPVAALSHVNRVLYENVRLRMQRDDHMTFMTARAASDGRVDFAGGHDVDLIVVSADGVAASHVSEGSWLALAPAVVGATANTLRLRPGDLLVMATDGLVDCPGRDGEPYTEERLVATVTRYRERPPGEIVECVQRDILAWKALAPMSASGRFDDVTMIIARYRGQTGAQG